MSQYGLIYRMSWDTVDIPRASPFDALSALSKTVTVNIYDTSILIDDADTPTVVDLTPAMPPLDLSTVNNDEDKFKTVTGTQAVIRFLSDSARGLTVTTFADQPDNRFYVEITAVSYTIFKGFLLLADSTQDFLPDPVIVELTASDMLGVLKDIALVDTSDINPIGKYRIIELIYMCLRKTGMNLDVTVFNNIQHGTGTRTMDITFVGSPNDIAVSNADAYYFYPGQEVTISGSVSNNSTFHVASLVTGLVTVVRFVENITGEALINVTVVDSSTGHFYDKCYLDAKTFEKNIGECEDCRTVLDKILGESCQLFQWKGSWCIKRIDEMDGNSVMYPFKFTPNGVAAGYQTPIQPNLSVGSNASVQGNRERGTKLRTDRPFKLVKETFKYETPKEIVCNIDFSRGAVITPPDLTLADGTGTYALDCWTLRRISGGITSTAFVTRRFVYGVEQQRYATITPAATTATPWDFIQSQAIELRQGDKASVSVDFRYDTNFGSGGVTVHPMRIYLLGDDGNWWYWWHPTSTTITDFYWTNAGTSEVERAIPVSWDAGAVDESQWQTLSVDLTSLPVSGKLYIGLIQGKQVASGGSDQNINYQGLQFTYKPYINGSYQLFTGQSNTVTRTLPAGYNAVRDQQVYISDSPRKEFKGAITWLDNNGINQLTTKFISANSFSMVLPQDGQYYHPYGNIQAFDVWNQYRNGNRIFPSSLYGLFREGSIIPDQYPSPMEKYSLTDANPNTNNRIFILISFNQDWKTCKWSGTFIEVLNTYTGRSYVDPLLFSYLTG